MDLSKKLNSAQMISLTQIFAQQPRNTVRHVFTACGRRCALSLLYMMFFFERQPNSLSVPYCQQAPRNAELNGLFQCQFQGANPTQFVGGVAAGQPGTTPFGKQAVLSPPGSCPAHTSGPIADGTQLVDQVSSPGVPSGSGTGNGSGNTPNPSPAPSSASASPVQATPSSPAAALASPDNSSPAPTPSSAAPSGSGASGFKVQNGKDAQALNQKFQSLTADSPCTGELWFCFCLLFFSSSLSVTDTLIC